MNIGVDAGALSIADERLKLGVYWVNVNLLRELSKIDKKNTYFLYSFLPIDHKLMAELGPRMVNRVLTPQKGWFSLRVPLELAMRPVDVFLGLSQGVPFSRSKNIGLVYDLGFIHHPDAYPNSRQKLTKITDDLVKRSDHIVTISQVVADDVVRRYGTDSKKITVAYPGVDSAFVPRGAKYKGKNPFFLFVGALKPGKNVPGLLRGFAKFLKGQKKPYDLHLGGGDYWKDPHIEKEIERLGIVSRVKKLGFVRDAKLASYYRGAVAFVSPSLYEGFGLPAVEAMACGCPVIGSTAGAFPEVVGDAGILVDPHDSSALAEAMNVMTDVKIRAEYIKKGVKRSKKYSWKTFARKIYKLL